MNRWQQVHQWLGLLIGGQLLLWLLTGLLLNLIPSEWFSAQQHQQNQAELTHINTVIDHNDVLQLSTTPLSAIRLVTIMTRPAYQLTQLNGETQFVWADTVLALTKNQQTLSPVILTTEQVQQIAVSSYRGNANISPAQLTLQTTLMPVSTYLVTADDDLKTRIYIDGLSGEVIGHKNIRSDWQQWLMMIHFMDYYPANGVSFNHFWTQIIAVLSVIFGLSGIRLLVYKFNQGHFSFRRRSTLTLHSQDQQIIGKIKGMTGSVLDNINQQASRKNAQGLQTNCAGSGECGLCAVQYLSSSPPATECDKVKLSQRKLSIGYRLSCQHSLCNADIMLSPQQVNQLTEKTPA